MRSNLFFLCAVIALARLDQADVDGFITQNRRFFRVFGDRRFQKILVVALGKIRLVMRAARFVAVERAEIGRIAVRRNRAKTQRNCVSCICA